jgi:predicted CXXCH cytochrome family protein
MKARIGIAAPLVAAAFSLSTVPAQAQDEFRLKPGATGKICVECHSTFEDTLALPFVHTPVKSGSCTGCHNPHTSSHGKLLTVSTGKICLECHEDVVSQDPASVHGMVTDGECSQCHDPHAGKHRGNLAVPANDLCRDCHQDLAQAIEAAAFKHAPVSKGCLGCHTPHASDDAGSLLKKNVPALCLDCNTAATKWAGRTARRATILTAPAVPRCCGPTSTPLWKAECASNATGTPARAPPSKLEPRDTNCAARATAT